MRTTVNLEPYVLLGLKAMAKREKTTLGKVIERLYAEKKRPVKSRFEHSPCGFPLLPATKPGAVTSEHVKELFEATEPGMELIEQRHDLSA